MPDQRKVVINPKTGNEIFVGGKVYQDLMKSPKYRAQILSQKTRSPTKKVQGRSPRKISIQSKPMPYGDVPISPSRKALIRRQQSYKSDKRGSATRGWRVAKPNPGRERHELKARCGSDCFLIPSAEKFPICPALRATSSPCKVDCRGVKSAQIRAKQWKYLDVAKKAEDIYNKYCREY